MPAFVLILWLPATIALLSVTFVIALGSAAPVPKGSVPLQRRSSRRWHWPRL